MDGHADEAGPLDRQEMIGITKDVQKFLATISELRLAMEEGDTQQKGMAVCDRHVSCLNMLILLS